MTEALAIDARSAAGQVVRPFSVTHRMVLAIAVPMTLAYLTTPLLGIVDMAVIGQLGQAELIGGLAIGAIIFDVVYTTFNFLRASTTGLVAQAFGRDDAREEQAVFWRSMLTGLICGFALLMLSPMILLAGLWLMAPGPGVAEAAQTYFSIRILSAPIGLANYSVLGFVLGRGEAITGLLLQMLINGVNIFLSIWLGLILQWGISGVAWATLIGEFVGLVAGFTYVWLRFDRSIAPSWRMIADMPSVMKLMALNRDIMIRSLALLIAFALFVRQGAQFGAVTLAANAVLMNFFMVAGYYLDGFATAAEQLAGRAVGANYRPAFDRAVSLSTIWGFGLAALTTMFFLLFGTNVVELMTTAQDVRAATEDYLVWASFTALAGVLAFTMDGVFIGATWSRDMRNMMLLSIIVYVACLWTLTPLFGNHGLWISLLIFLGIRGISLYLLVRPRANATFQTTDTAVSTHSS
ncbi:MAG: MATE family efflux transporter [Rhizobiaceae bacterium MnEN-MB40S]|nr:MAG: MATE family efflux transporter [Rhizobiaceae bacterium MnEN-MB40S]